MLRSKDNLYQEIIDFVQKAKDLIIFSPYIRQNPLGELLRHTNAKSICIVTTWKPRDVAFGSSDLDIYKLCRENKIPLYINNNIHLKVITKNKFSSCIVSSANITRRGLGVSNEFNVEMGIINDTMELDDILYLEKIINDPDCRLVNDDYYEQIKKESESIKVSKDMQKSFSTDLNKAEKEFLISSLPMSNSVNNLMNYYFNKDSLEDPLAIRSAEHDIELYKLKDIQNETEFLKSLKDNFYNHPFVIEFLEQNGDKKSFGENSTWIHNRCTTVPTPWRKDVKDIQNNLNKFVVDLSDGRYEEKILYKHTKFLIKVK